MQMVNYYNDMCKVKDVVTKPNEINYTVSCSTKPQKNQTLCQAQRQVETDIDPDNVYTTCDSSGKYTQKQCNKTHCWCANPDNGQIISKPVRVGEPLNCNIVEKFDNCDAVLESPMPSSIKPIEEKNPHSNVDFNTSLAPQNNETCSPIDHSSVKPITEDNLNSNIYFSNTLVPQNTKTCAPVDLSSVEPHKTDLYSEKIFDRQTLVPHIKTTCNSNDSSNTSVVPHDNNIYGKEIQIESDQPAFSNQIPHPVSSGEPIEFNQTLPTLKPSSCKKETLNPNLMAGNSCDNYNNNPIFGLSKN